MVSRFADCFVPRRLALHLTKNRTLLLVVAVVVAFLVQFSGWMLGERLVDASGWLLYVATVLALAFLSDPASRETPESRIFSTALQCLFLATFLTLYDQNAVFLAMVPPARFRRGDEDPPDDTRPEDPATNRARFPEARERPSG